MAGAFRNKDEIWRRGMNIPRPSPQDPPPIPHRQGHKRMSPSPQRPATGSVLGWFDKDFRLLIERLFCQNALQSEREQDARQGERE